MKSLYAVVLFVAACASTTMLSTWKDPAVGRLAFHKVLVVAPARDASLRKTAEDELAREIKNAQAMPSYTMIPDAELGNSEAVRARARTAGFDGVVIMRVASVDREATWVPGTWSGPGYAYGGWPVYDPGYTRIDTYVRVETNVYSVSDDKLVWASASRTTNPDSVKELVKDTAKEIGKEMRKEGMVP